MSVSPTRDEQSLILSETVALRCLGQRQLDKERCPEAAALCSKARPFAPRRAFSVQRKVARPAKGSPSGGAGERSETERASRLSQSRCTAISRLFVRAILSQCKSCLSASLPSPSSQAMPPLPKGEALAGRKAQNPLSEIAALRPASYLIQWHYYRDDSPKISVYQVIQSVHIDTVRQCISKVIVSS